MDREEVAEASAPKPGARDKVDMEIYIEQCRQRAKFGVQNHDPFKYLSILTEEVGEAAQAANDCYTWSATSPGNWNTEGLKKSYRQELIQVAAVAKSMVECLDRGTFDAK